MYNFLDAKLIPKVTSPSPATDNYEATNLIHENLTIRARGYIAYTIIRPPVELEFEFLCSVDIRYISINAVVGRQRCTGIEIFAKVDGLYCSIAKGIFSKERVVFCTSHYYSKLNPPEEGADLLFFKRNEFRVFTNAKFVKIVIFKTDGKSVPCLGNIKIFGVPSKSCSATTRETIAKIMGLAPRFDVTTSSGSESSSSSLNDLKIPQDFIDSLTCDIMAIPMTLPSGNTIDRDTLEKHIENEKSFGRKPGDPFTGLKFTDSRKPVINTALKSRIDMFLMENSNNPKTFSLKRALGSDWTNPKRLKIEDKKCCTCEETTALYVIPCRHYYCRKCLLGIHNIKCENCGHEFAKSEATRCHI